MYRIFIVKLGADGLVHHFAECHYALCRFAECHNAESLYDVCHYAEYHYCECLYVMLILVIVGVFMLIVVILSVAAPLKQNSVKGLNPIRLFVFPGWRPPNRELKIIQKFNKTQSLGSYLTGAVCHHP